MTDLFGTNATRHINVWPAKKKLDALIAARESTKYTYTTYVIRELAVHHGLRATYELRPDYDVVVLDELIKLLTLEVITERLTS